jgi:ATP-dependent Clp protease ATP-binding subunit ClpB
VTTPPTNLSDAAGRAIERAQAEARALGGAAACTEHLLVALAAGDDAVAALLAEARAPAEAIRSALGFVFGRDPPSSADPPISPKIERVLARAAKEARRRGAPAAGTEHLLLGLLAEGGRGAGVLTLLGVTPQRLRDRLLPELGQESAARPVDPLPDPLSGPFDA